MSCNVEFFENILIKLINKKGKFTVFTTLIAFVVGIVAYLSITALDSQNIAGRVAAAATSVPILLLAILFYHLDKFPINSRVRLFLSSSVIFLVFFSALLVVVFQSNEVDEISINGNYNHVEN